MNYKLVKLNLNMGQLEYEMYQDIPKEEVGSLNSLKDESYEAFISYINSAIKYELEIDPKVDSTTNKYIFYADDYPIGEIAIRTTLNEHWINRGSQIYYKIRLSERGKGYGTIMLKLALIECRELGFETVSINCNNHNLASQKVIAKNGGECILNYGESSRYKIKI